MLWWGNWSNCQLKEGGYPAIMKSTANPCVSSPDLTKRDMSNVYHLWMSFHNVKPSVVLLLIKSALHFLVSCKPTYRLFFTPQGAAHTEQGPEENVSTVLRSLTAGFRTCGCSKNTTAVPKCSRFQLQVSCI